MDDIKYFDLTDTNKDINKLSIEKDGIFDCIIKDQQGNSYDGFILAKTGTRGYMTLLECGFNSNDKGKHKPRLTFRKTDKNFKDRNVSKGSDQVIISVKTNDEGNANLRKVLGFLYKFKESTDLGDFDKYFTLTDSDIGFFLQKLSLDENKDKITAQLYELSPEELQNIADVTHTTKVKKTLEEFQIRLTQNYPETQGDDSWQSWISKNNWLFGVNYKQPIEKAKINLSGIMPDFLYPSIDGFIDILEIKLPSHEVIKEDKSHQGSRVRSTETNKAIGQVINYMGEIERMRLENEKTIEDKTNSRFFFLKPRAFILIGDNDSWSKNQKEGLRKLNYYLHNIEVITYRDLLERGKKFLSQG